MSPPTKHLLFCNLTLAAILLTTTAYAPAQSQPAKPTTQSAITSLEEELWKDIMRLGQSVPTTQPHDQWFETATRRREERLREVRAYLMLYPGGSHRDEALRLELEELFELAVLRNTGYVELATRVRELLRDPPSPVAHEEAAYWNLILRHMQSKLASRPAPAHSTSPASPLADPDLRDDYQNYLRQFPTSRYAPRLATHLFTDALRRDDPTTAERMVNHLREHFPDHQATIMLAGRWRRQTALGQPFALSFQSATAGGQINTRDWLGEVTLVVVWARFSPAARACVARVEQFRREHPTDLAVVGVSLDPTPQALHQACDTLGIRWPQYFDGRGWGHRFALRWGIQNIPLVFVIDRRGRLLGTVGHDRWQALARVALGRQH